MNDIINYILNEASCLATHGRKELELAGMYDSEVDGSKALGAWNKLTADAVVELLDVFGNQGHSGMSGEMALELFCRLGRFENLTEITDDPDEWIDRTKESGEPFWQNDRNYSIFSNDGGKTHWHLDSPKDIKTSVKSKKQVAA
jgi:hypothetical protein